MGRRKGGRKRKSNGIVERSVAQYAKGLCDGNDLGKTEVFNDIFKYLKECDKIFKKISTNPECNHKFVKGVTSLINLLIYDITEIKKKHLKPKG